MIIFKNGVNGICIKLIFLRMPDVSAFISWVIIKITNVLDMLKIEFVHFY